MSAEHIHVSHENFRQTWETIVRQYPSGEIRRFGSILGVSAGVPSPMYNRLFVLETPGRDDLSAAIDWLGSRGVPFGVFIADAVLEAVETWADEVSLESMDVAFPGMVLPSIGGVSSSQTGVDITAVTTDEDFDAFRTVLTSIPEFPTDVDVVMPATILESEMITLFLGRTDGDPCVCGWLGQGAGVAGVYGIGVDEAYRRQGLGEAMTRAVLRTGRDSGCEAAVLQSTPMAVPLYELLGFETVTKYHLYTPTD